MATRPLCGTQQLHLDSCPLFAQPQRRRLQLLAIVVGCLEAEVAAEFTPLCQVKDLFLSEGDVVLGGWAVAGLLLLDVGGTERVAAALLNAPLSHNVIVVRLRNGKHSDTIVCPVCKL